ncbi:hypothetical protein EJB05_11939 [Eragrostis curvula]|uniref:Uncharacterized protein n=1 Tax=Eragrostis curvula TaxID=38414 RepID=A0A5J9VU06_9POAL|nr:hypothetical protein EJB05_11939 [Eragrostis curvula]
MHCFPVHLLFYCSFPARRSWPFAHRWRSLSRPFGALSFSPHAGAPSPPRPSLDIALSPRSPAPAPCSPVRRPAALLPSTAEGQRCRPPERIDPPLPLADSRRAGPSPFRHGLPSLGLRARQPALLQWSTVSGD